ncbi:uncharacterized protein SCHCODRAFT_02492628 [Schizophyllum commune H4-8]|uniref:Uncharacterized protein n=1 Tax=Schizophyllum commune (strain H4-8 / FGSC 9210) TaxID=578458 RepID=D8PYG0_SCHCM|nr:uncharacterized protein SCHCODRAFT_02492628 [Schizophyllum commune H4-8]KAI5895940.1 hypothetical protein SCHCODRAFT_02492628 [Schizophyllum commune H4-8]
MASGEKTPPSRKRKTNQRAARSSNLARARAQLRGNSENVAPNSATSAYPTTDSEASSDRPPSGAPPASSNAPRPRILQNSSSRNAAIVSAADLASRTSKKRKHTYTIDDWKNEARNARRKLERRDEEVAGLKAEVHASEEILALERAEHARNQRMANLAHSSVWSELQKARDTLTKEEKEKARLQNLLTEQDERLAEKLKEESCAFDEGPAEYYSRSSPPSRVSRTGHSPHGVFRCAEHAVGGVIRELGRLVGIRRLNRIPSMSARTVARIIAEGGIAAKIQLGYEMVTNTSITASGDSTSHRRQEYDSRFVVLRPVTDSGILSDSHVLRSLGIDASLDHSSEEQVRGLLKKLAQICDIFNRSPFAKRKGLLMSFEAFALRLRGTSGDHANDVKKDNKLLLEWKLEMTKIALGFEALRQMSTQDSLRAIIPHARAAILDVGGSEAWERLNAATRTEKETALTRSAAKEVGELAYARLNPDEKKKMSLFLFTGCCMHKELNSVKGGDARMRTYYATHPEIIPPVLLANKDNAAVLAGITDNEQLTPAELRALSVSGCGAVKATTLAGMICNNKDSKKGQHDRYVWYFDKVLGPAVIARRFPDVSNTRFQSHCAAACEILQHLKLYRAFMRHVFYKKDKPGFTNIRGPGMTALNALTLGPLHTRLENFIKTLIADTTLVLGPNASYKTAAFDGEPWEREGVFEAIAALRKADLMPHLERRGSAEFDPGSDIDGLTADEQDEFWMPVTNDANESALGGLRANVARRPNQTLHQFEAKDTFRRNGTQGFIDCFEDEDHRYVRGEARRIQESRPQRQIRRAQVAHDDEEARRHQLVEEEKNKKALAWQERLEAIVFVAEEDRLQTMRKVELTDQLNYWRHKLLAPKVAPEYSIPNRPHKIAELKRLLALYPNGAVPECEREGPKRKAPTASLGPESVLQDMVVTPRVLIVYTRARLMIIFIPDPMLSRSVIEHEEGESYLYEMTCWIDPQVLSRMEVSAPQCIRSENAREVDADTGDVSASFWEWAYLPEALVAASVEKEGLNLSVEALGYPEFVAAVMSHSSEDPTWCRLLAADVVIGGPALNENYMHPAYMINFDTYVAGITLLEQDAFIWPCAKSLWWGGNKVLLAATLDSIAAQTTHTPRPPQHVLQTPPDASKMGWVQKRGYSARAEHVLIPGDTQVGGARKCPDDPAPLEARWIEQVYIDTLHDARFGELRCFIVGGNIIRIVRTVPSGGGMKCNVVLDNECPSLAQHW